MPNELKKLKELLAVLIIISYLLSIYGIFLPYLDYEINREVFLKECINKDKPEMHCDGKCQLEKEIQYEAKKENSTNRISSKNPITLHINPLTNIFIDSFSNEMSLYFYFKHFKNIYLIPKTHPPQYFI